MCYECQKEKTNPVRLLNLKLYGESFTLDCITPKHIMVQPRYIRQQDALVC